MELPDLRFSDLELEQLRAEIVEMYDALHANIKIARIHASDVEWPTRLDKKQAEHEEIVEALEKKQAARLVKAMRKHIFRSRDSLVAALDSM